MPNRQRHERAALANFGCSPDSQIGKLLALLVRHFGQDISEDAVMNEVFAGKFSKRMRRHYIKVWVGRLNTRAAERNLNAVVNRSKVGRVYLIGLHKAEE